MKRLFIACSIVTVSLLVFSSKVQAQTLAYDFTALGTTGTSGFERGWAFTPVRPITITALGMYAHSGVSWNGGTANYFEVRLWNNDTQAMVTSGFVDGLDPLEGFFRFRNKTINLTAGQTYVISASMQGQTMAWTPVGFAAASDITYIENRNSTAGNFPSSVQGGFTPGTFGPNFKYNPTAAVFDWTNNAGGNFSDGGNWTYPVTPTSVDIAVFDLNDTYTVNFTESLTNSYFRILNDDVTFNLNGNTYTTTSNGSSSSATTIGRTNGDVAVLKIQNGGTLTSGYTIIGDFLNSEGNVTVNGPTTVWNTGGFSFRVGWAGDASLTIENGASVNTTSSDTSYIALSSTSQSNVTVTGNNSRWDIANDFTIGSSGDATLLIEDGGVVNSMGTEISVAQFGASDSSVTIDTATWNITNSLYVGGTAIANSNGIGTVTVEAGGLLDIGSDLILWSIATLDVNAGGTFNIGGTLTLEGGHYEFASISFADFTSINAVSGTLAGDVQINGFNDVASYTALHPTEVDLSQVRLANSGVLFGNANLQVGLTNQASGEVRVTTGQWIRFGSGASTNSGEIKNTGGTVEFGSLTNNADGIVSGRGTFELGDGSVNFGFFAFSGGFADVYGSFTNDGGTIAIAGGSTTTFYDDVTDNGGTIDVGAGSFVVFFGSYNGGTTGLGTVYMNGNLGPGNSPAAVSFGGDVQFGSTAQLSSELGGTTSGSQFDQVNVIGEVTLSGTLDVSLINSFAPEPGDQFVILTYANHQGEFDSVQFPSSDLVWQISYGANETTVMFYGLLGDIDLNGTVDNADLAEFVKHYGTTIDADWQSGDFNDDGKTDLNDLLLLKQHFGETYSSSPPSPVAVPEPSSFLLVLLASVGLGWFYRRRVGK